MQILFKQRLLHSTMYAILITALVCFTIQATFAQIDTSECGTEFGCAKSPESCTSSEDCDFLLKYTIHLGKTVRAQMSTKGPQWIALGFNQEVPRLMVGTKGVLCKHINTTVYIDAFDATEHNTPNIHSTTDAGIITAGAMVANGALICKFHFPLTGSLHLRNLTDPQNKVAVIAWGASVDQATGDIHYHGRGNYFAQVLDVTKLDVYQQLQTPAPPQITTNPTQVTTNSSPNTTTAPSNSQKIFVQPGIMLLTFAVLCILS